MDVSRIQFSVCGERGQVIKTLLRDLREDVDPLNTALGEVFNRRCSLHRCDGSTFANRKRESS